MFFSNLLVAAFAATTTVSALVTPVTRNGGLVPIPPKPPGVSTKQYQDILVKCGDTKQVGLVNVNVDACIVAELEALVGAILKERNGVPVPPKPPGVSTDQYQKILVKCGDTKQVGLVNVIVAACIVAELEAIVGILKRNGGQVPCPPKPPGVSTSQYQKILVDCGDTKQVGLVNVNVAACIVAELAAIVGVLKERNGGLVPIPVKPPGVSTKQYQDILVKCGDTKQVGLVNVNVDACIVAELAAIVGALKRNGGQVPCPPKPPGVSTSQYQNILVKCGDTKQVGLVNVNVAACIVAELAAIVGVLKERNGGLVPIPVKPPGVSTKQYQDILVKCGDTKQVGLVNVNVDACIVAELEALVGAILKERDVEERNGGQVPCPPKPPGVSTSQYQKILVDCGDTKQVGLVNVNVAACIVAELAAIVGVL